MADRRSASNDVPKQEHTEPCPYPPDQQTAPNGQNHLVPSNKPDLDPKEPQTVTQKPTANGPPGPQSLMVPGSCLEQSDMRTARHPLDRGTLSEHSELEPRVIPPPILLDSPDFPSCNGRTFRGTILFRALL